jgi:hypothetical protein
MEEHIGKTGSQFYINSNHLGPIGTVCLFVVIAVPVVSMGAILSVFLMTCFNRVGFRKLGRTVTDQVMGIRRKKHRNNSDRKAKSSESVQNSDIEEDDVEPSRTLSPVIPLNRPCICCKIRHVISVLFLRKFGGSGDCFAKVSGSANIYLSHDLKLCSGIQCFISCHM